MCRIIKIFYALHRPNSDHYIELDKTNFNKQQFSLECLVRCIGCMHPINLYPYFMIAFDPIGN